MIKIETCQFTRISKRRAENLYNQGETIYIVPCKVYPSNDNHWIKPYDIKLSNDIDSFDRVVSSFEYYNCNYNETGKYTAFYIKNLEG